MVEAKTDQTFVKRFVMMVTIVISLNVITLLEWLVMAAP
jgi:hypothetical protein